MGDKYGGPSKDTAAGDVVIISVPSDGPYGVMFEPDRDGNAAVIKAWERLPNGKFGQLQKHGGLHYGDVLFQINDNHLDVVPFKDVMQTVKDRNLLKKSFRFMNSVEYYRRKEAKNAPKLAGLALGSERGNAFMSTIRQTRLSVDTKGSKYCEYEVACQYRVVSRRVQKEVVYKWSVWRRYSEFEKLHLPLKDTLGWQIDGIELPSANTFVFNKLSQEFIENRRDELNTYWQKIIKVNNGQVVEFHKHHSQTHIKDFLEVDRALSGEIGAPPDVVGEGVGSTRTEPSSSSRPSSRRMSGKVAAGSSRRPSSTRGSVGGFAGSGGFNDSTPSAAVPRSGGAVSSPTSASPQAPPSPAPAAEAPPPPPAAAPPGGLPEGLQRFKKMLDVGMPAQAVSNKMLSEGFFDKDINKVLEAGGASIGGGSAAAAPPPPAAKIAAAPAAPAAPAAAAGKVPPKATGARASLLGDIAKRRIE